MYSILFLFLTYQVVFGLEILRDTNGCNNKICFVKDNWHVALVVHQKTDDNAGPTALEIQLEKKLDKTERSRYISVGFSPDGQMGSSAVPVTSCIYDPDKPNSPSYAMSFNRGYENARITNISFENWVLINPQLAVINGVFVCKFSQLAVSPPNFEPSYDVTAKNYFLILATGEATEKDLKRHDEKPISSPQLDFQNRKFLGEAKIGCVTPEIARLLTKVHAILMIFGWWLIVPTALFFARYFKQIWPDTQPFGIRLWFHFHRGFNLFALLLVVGSFVVILVKDCGGWVAEKSQYHRVHTITGLTAIIAIMVQPLMSLFRCAPTDRKRPIFNWIHRIIGLGGLFCSCAAIWWGKKFSMGLNQKYWNGDPAMGIMIFYFVVLGVTAIALEIHMFVTEVVKNPNSKLREIQMRGFGKRNEMRTFVEKPEQPYTSAWAHVRGGILGFFILCATGVTVALSAMIGVVP